MAKQKQHEAATEKKPKIIETIEARYAFTPDERLELGDRLAGLTHQIAELEEAKKAQAAEYKGQIDLKAAEAGMVSIKLRNGYEMRPTDCYVVFEPKGRRKHYHKVGSGEFVRTAEMTAGDFQLHFPDVMEGGVK